MSYVLILLLFVWILIIQDQLTTLKTKLQKMINEGYIASKSQETTSYKAESMHEAAPVWETASTTEEEFKFVKSTVESISPAIKNTHVEISQFEKKEQKLEPEKDKSGFEKIFLGNIFNKIGALAIIIGIAFFIKVVSQYIVFTPVMKISLAFLAGAGMVCGALKLHKDKMKNYAEVLMGTGFAVLFITMYCAAGLYHIMPVAVSTVFGILFVLLTYYIADRFNTFSTFLIGFAGGYLNPFLINSNISINFLFGYLLFLNLISAVYVLKNENKKPLNYINLILTTFTVIIFAGVKGVNVNYLFPVCLWVLYTVNDIIEIVKNRYNESYKGNLVFCSLNFLCFVCFMRVFNFSDYSKAGLFTILVAIVYAVFLNIYKNRDNGHIRYFTYGILLSLFTATYFMLDSTIRVDVWALEGLALAYIAIKHRYVTNWAAVFLVCAFVGTLFVPNAVFYSDLKLYHPIFNFRLALFGIPALCACISSYWLKDNKNLSDTLKFLGLSLVYMFVVFETNSMCGKYLKSANVDIVSVKMFLYSITGFIYAINTKRLAQSLQSNLFNFAGVTIFVISALIMLSVSIFGTNTGMLAVFNLRLLAYLFAISTAIYYSRQTGFKFYSYLAVVFGFLCTHFEISAVTSDNALAISVAWIIYACAVTLSGMFLNKRFLTKSGIWIFVLASLKVMLFDISNMGTLYKFIAFLTLGVILMIVSYVFSKMEKN